MEEALKRRRFVLNGLAASILPRLSLAEHPDTLTTLTQWISANERERELGIQACLDRIRDMDSSIQAWVQVSPEKATGKGKLSGIPFGVKDIIETKGLATEYGSPIYKGRIGTADAVVVQEFRNRGAVVLGKTQCAAFAYKTPPPTRNPRNLEHTPGGSSSGSAAAVAASMVPFALGTQTRGSVLRPASFCGVTGFKPTFGWMSVEGVLPCAKTQDTLGLFTHSAADMILLWEALGHDIGTGEELTFGVPGPLQEVEPEMSKIFENTLSIFRKAGLSIQQIKMGNMLEKLSSTNEMITLFEGARFHRQRYEEYGDRLDDVSQLVRDGLKISDETYNEGMQYVSRCKQSVSELMKTTPVILTPAAPGPAPLGLSSTGNARMNAPWTALGTPSISIPMPVGNDLPLGLQLATEHGQESRLLKIATRLEKILAGAR